MKHVTSNKYTMKQNLQTKPVNCSNDCPTRQYYYLLESSSGNIPSDFWP